MTQAAVLPEPKYYGPNAHAISIEQLNPHALDIIRQLTDAGYKAYLVGGCIRDLLLNESPKDFDIATDALPEDIAKIFRNCRLIGRRFRLAHIYFGREIIEVATFRGASAEERPTGSDGRILEDNYYGSMAEDALRRDFTINALYYDVGQETIIDYVGGMEDLRARVIRMIGDPQARYIEDPVRILRAARLSAKLNIPLAEETEAAIAPLRKNLRSMPAARLFDEVQKLFMTGHGVKSFETMQHYDLLSEVLPDISRILTHPNAEFARYSEKVMRIALANTDNRLAEGKPVTIAFLFSAFLWPVYQLQYQGLLQERDNWHSAMHEAVDIVSIAASERIAIPIRLRSMMREIWTIQARFDLIGSNERKMPALLAHPRFRAAYDFLLIRNEAGEKLGTLVKRWTDAQEDPDYTPIHRRDNPRNNRNTIRRRRPRNNARQNG